MKVVLISGENGREALNQVETEVDLAGQGISATSVPFMTDISLIKRRGDNFDRCLVGDKGLGASQPNELRKRIGQFAQLIKLSFNNSEVVFLTGEKEIAKIILEETALIQNNVTIVYEKPDYSIDFICSLLSSDIECFPRECLYTGDEADVFADVGVLLDDVALDEPTQLVSENQNIWIDQVEKSQGKEETVDGLVSSVATENTSMLIEDTEGDIEPQAGIKIEEIDLYANSTYGEAQEDEDEEDDESDAQNDMYRQNVYGSNDDDVNGEECTPIPEAHTIQQTPNATVKKPQTDKYAIKQHSGVDINWLTGISTRGVSIAITGFGGTGTSTIAYNLANVLNELGFVVLLVDFDLKNRSQCVLNSNNTRAMDMHDAGLITALRSNKGSAAFVSVAKQGFRVVGTGIDCNIQDNFECVAGDKIIRFMNTAKTSYNFVVYDIPFDYLSNYYPDVGIHSDHMVLVTDTDNRGLHNMSMAVYNIDNRDLFTKIFDSGQLILNRYKELNQIFGSRLRRQDRLLTIADKELERLVREPLPRQLDELSVCYKIPQIIGLDSFWYTNKGYSDSVEGAQMYGALLESILKRKEVR